MTSNYEKTASVTKMLQLLHWDTLEVRHNNFRDMLLYKLVDVHPGHYKRPPNEIFTVIDAYKNFSTIRIWNSSPSYVFDAATFDLLKIGLFTDMILFIRICIYNHFVCID